MKKGGTSNWREVLDLAQPDGRHVDLADVRARSA